MEPKQLWKRLEDMFLRKDAQQKLLLAKRFADLKWEPRHMINAFLADLADIRAVHRSAGLEISDQDAYVKLLSCLPAEYGVERSILANTNEYDLNQA